MYPSILEKRRIIQAAAANGWKISPIATAVALSAHDSRPYKPYAHLRLLSDKIRHAVISGGRLIISMPPQHGKSWQVSKWAPAWCLENWPHDNIILTGYGKGFAKDWGRIVRNLVNRHKDKLSFTLAEDSTAADYWHTNKDGSLLCAGVGSGITGKPADLIIIDDAVKGHEAAASYTQRESIWSWYLTEARTRLARGGAIIVVMTRWNEDDLAGRLINNNTEGWEVVNLPAIYDEKAAAGGPCPLGRKIGDLLCPDLHDAADLNAQKQNSNEVWESLYQGRPGTTAGLGNVYTAFDDKANVRSCDRDPMSRMFVSLDFNVDPMCGVIGQYKEFVTQHSILTNERYAVVEVLDEICLPDSNTSEWTQELVVRLKKICGAYDTDIELYGDPAGRSRHTSQVAGSDYDIIRELFKLHRQFNLRFNVKSSAPSIKDRVNAVNKMFLNALHERRTFVDPRCKMLRRDLVNVKWKRDASGNTTGQLAKDQKDLTHASDALGYFMETKFGRSQDTGERSGLLQ